MISVQEALDIIDASVTALPAEKLPVDRAAGRVTAEREVSRLNLPPFRQSAMDGYAVRAVDLEGASAENPVTLEVVGEVAAGASEEPPAMGPGQTLRIFTGGRMPVEADAVLRQERATRQGDRITVEREVSRGYDVRPEGEEMARGEVIVEAGRRLGPSEIAGLAMSGHGDLSVHLAPSVMVLITGDEVIAPGVKRRGNELYDANGPYVLNWLREQTAGLVDMEYVQDDPEEVADHLERALEGYDLVVTTGGVSVGERDYVIDCAESLGVKRHFWKIAHKPGKPLYFGSRGDAPLLGLPGNPGAVFTAVNIYLRRALDGLQGLEQLGPSFEVARTTTPIRRKPGRTQWVGGTLEVDESGVMRFEPFLGHQGHRMGALFRADALARVEPGDEPIESDGTVQVVTCS